MSKALMRHHLERIDGVRRTWLEWCSEGDDILKTLVVEVDFDTDPNNAGFRQNVIDAIWDTAKSVQGDTTMTISNLRIVPRAA